MRNVEKLIYENERGETIEFSVNSVFHVNVDKDVSGLADIQNEIYSISGMEQDGETFIAARIESRDIEIEGSIKERNKDKRISLRRKLTHIMNPKQKAKLYYEYGDFRRVIGCVPENAPFFSKSDIYTDFSIQLVCSDPFWNEEFETREDIATWIGAFEFPLEIPYDIGIEFGYRQLSLIVNVLNGGDVPCGIRVDFRALGTVTNPYLLNLETREFIKFNNCELEAGDVLSISTYYGKKSVTITHNGITTDAFRLLDVDSTYIQLNVGDNLFRYDADSNLENLEVSVYHNDRFLGV